MPVGNSDAPAGDFEAECRGAMEHAKHTLSKAVDGAIEEKVEIICSRPFCCFWLRVFVDSAR
jgi:hypothetical protein